MFPPPVVLGFSSTVELDPDGKIRWESIEGTAVESLISLSMVPYVGVPAENV